ncbi:hypothetical protein [Niallia taxi]|uniref:hypothetical protein n=1 Tax=Niallia taxi TaxID=2499688 RepID=UPI0015F66BDE|nr:hypothetical protein [Niallia taxi]
MAVSPDDYDVVLAQISRSECEKLEFSHLTETMKIVESKGREGYKSFILAFDGWESDSSELYEIPAVRKYISEMVKRYPYIFYHITDMQSLDMLYLAALGDLSTFMKENTNQKAVYDVSIPEAIYKTIYKGTLSYGEKVGDIENARRTIQRINEVLGK